MDCTALDWLAQLSPETRLALHIMIYLVDLVLVCLALALLMWICDR